MSTNKLTDKEIKIPYPNQWNNSSFKPTSGSYINQLNQALNKLIYDNPHIRPEKLVSTHVENGSEGIKGSQVFINIALDDIILNFVSQLIGEDIILWEYQVFCELGGDGMQVPWHQDGKYWSIRPLVTCTAWIAIDDSTIKNGCLRVIPESYSKKQIFEYYQNERKDIVLDQELDSRIFDE